MAVRNLLLGITCALILSVNAFGQSSDIVAKVGYSYQTNIPYQNHQASNIINDANSLEVAAFTIRDGGASSTDPDSDDTNLTSITFSVSNAGLIRRIAIYDDANNELAEAAGASSVTFSSLGYPAPDNGSRDFRIRVSFNSTVTDNQQFQFTITAATATGSTFATANAGGAQSSMAGNDNRIEVLADQLIFTTQPPTVNTIDVN
ncbi:MAG: hypothetical protein ACK51D_04280, partial [Cyclobacteriaceae bacterium]